MRTITQVIHELNVSEISSILAAHFSASNSVYVDYLIDTDDDEDGTRDGKLVGATIRITESVKEKG